VRAVTIARREAGTRRARSPLAKVVAGAGAARGPSGALRRHNPFGSESLSALSALLRIAGEPRLGGRALGRLATRLAHALDVPALTIRLLDPSGRWLDLKAAVGLSKRMRTRLRRIPVDSAVGKEVVRRGRRIVRAGDPDASMPPWPRSVLRRFGAGVFVPIRAGAEVRGVLGVGFRESTRPPAAQIRFLDALGRQLGTALHVISARETRRKTRSETRFLRRIAAALSANLELPAILDMVTSAAQRLTRASGAIVMLLSRDGTEFEIISASRSEGFDIRGVRFPVEGSLSGVAVRTGRCVRCRDASTERRALLRSLQQTGNVRGLLIVPLHGDGGVIGVLNVSSTRPRVFSDHDRRTLMQLGHQASIAIRNARLFEDVRNHRQLLRQLYSQQSSVLESERKRIAHELHDEMGPTLSAILINLQLLKERSVNGTLGAKIVETETLLTGIIEKIRELAYGLRPPMLEHLGLAESLKWMIETYFSGGHLVVDYRVSGPPVHLDPDLALAIYRIAQEALTNVVKHARAARVKVRLHLAPAAVRLEVHDDGRGFDAVRLGAERRAGLGLASMRERMDHLQGRLELRSQPGKGSRLTVTCPLEIADARALG
jgi:signal transduction histidine kinase